MRAGKRGDMSKPEPNTLILDIESSLDILAAYGLREQYHSPENLIQDWFIICFAYKWLGGKRIYSYSILDDIKRWVADHTDDYSVVKRMHEVVSECDVIVGHNMARFDWRKFMARVIYHGLPPLNKPAIVDTLKEARKLASFTSNKMSYLAKHLKVEHKLEHAGDMWIRILSGDAKALKEAVAYCRGDIVTTEALYLRLRPYMETHPNHNLWRGDGIECCPKCGSESFQHRGFRNNTTTRIRRYQCNECFTWFSGSSVKRVKIK